MPPTPLSAPPIARPLSDVTTDRLDLRRFVESDLDEIAPVFAKPEVWRFPYGRGFDRAETAEFLATQQRHWETCGFGLWIVRERGSERVVGFVGLSVPTFLPEVLPAVEVGWRFDPEYWGRGYASEGARAALDAAFDELELDAVCSIPQAENPASYRVCERLGLRLEREVTIPANERRGPLAALLYGIERDAWRERRSAPPTDR
jgi:RimJ/RimL family protein N-acetyltransferase